MSDEIPTPSKGFYIFIELLALGAVLTGFEEFDKKQYWPGGMWVLFGAIVLFFGIAGLSGWLNRAKRKSDKGSDKNAALVQDNAQPVGSLLHAIPPPPVLKDVRFSEKATEMNVRIGNSPFFTCPINLKEDETVQYPTTPGWACHNSSFQSRTNIHQRHNSRWRGRR